MYAVIETGGKQYKVVPEELFAIEQLAGEVGSTVTFERVLAIGNEGGDITVDSASLKKATVNAEIVEQFRGPKIVVFKMKRRKGYRHTIGHRQELTKVKITGINVG